ncbi:MAG: ROK family protein [Candidatus Aminicenantes bacterium]|nr:ROK family protein [Candidatus Aminicenantes bacterium]
MNKQTVVGVDLGGTNVRAGKISGRKITARCARPITALGSQDQVLQEVCQTIAAVFDHRVIAIGIGVPSLVDAEKGIVYAVGNIPSWREVPLREHLQNTFNVPVHVNNDANCFALGEFRFGAGRGFRNLVGMILGTGLGAGIIMDGELRCGRHCGAGEIGKIPYREHNVEYYSSGQFFQHQFGMDGGVLYERAREGNSQALEMFETFGENLGDAVMIALYAFDPEIIVLGGSVSRAWPFFEKAMRRKFASFAYPHALARTVIQPAQTPDISLLGAAALCLSVDTSISRT